MSLVRLEETFLTKSSTSLRKEWLKRVPKHAGQQRYKRVAVVFPPPMWPNAKIFSSEKHWCVILRTSPVRDFYTFHPRTFGARGCSSSLTPMAHHLTATQGQDRLAEKAKSRPFMFQQIYCAMVITMVSTAGSSRNPSHNGFFVNGYIHNHKSLWMMTIPKSVGATQHKQCSKPQNHPYFHCTSWLRFPHGLW